MFDGHAFNYRKDFEIYASRRHAAIQAYVEFCALGYESCLVHSVLNLFVDGWLSIEQCQTILAFRMRCIRDYGTAYPELDAHTLPDMFATNLLEIGIVEGEYNGVPVLDDHPPVELFPND